MENNNIGFKPDYEEEALTFDQTQALKGETLLEFGAPWCKHCQASTTAVKKALTVHSAVSHIKIYDGKGKPLGRAFNVKHWPTLILLRNGHEVDRLVRPLKANEVHQLIIKNHVKN